MSLCSGLTRNQSNNLYDQVLNDHDVDAMRELCTDDLFFLLTRGCKRMDIDKDWLYDRCREVEASPNGHLDLWAREHFKSSIITFGMTIKDILKDPNVTIGIFSHTRPIAKAFLGQIKTELEQNTFLRGLFSDILYENPKGEAERWSLDGGIVVKRSENPKEATVEAWGLVDGQPTSKHFKILVYDDVVTKDSVTTPEQIKKTTEAISLSYNLGAQGGKMRAIGTRYHQNDTYRVVIERGTFNPRLHPARVGGEIEGAPVFMSDELLKKKRADQGPYQFGSQMLLNPVADKAMGFKEEWLKYYKSTLKPETMNIYIVVDPAHEKKKNSDYTVMEVIGLAPDNNYYLIEGVRDRFNLTERATKLFHLHRKYKPLRVGYEKYGMQSDIEHLRYEMEHRNYRFDITPLGGQMSKADRIKKLIPIFEQHRMWMPKKMPIVDYEGKEQDYISLFIDHEYMSFPVSIHDDMLDCRARILDPALGAEFPEEQVAEEHYEHDSYSGGWAG